MLKTKISLKFSDQLTCLKCGSIFHAGNAHFSFSLFSLQIDDKVNLNGTCPVCDCKIQEKFTITNKQSEQLITFFFKRSK